MATLDDTAQPLAQEHSVVFHNADSRLFVDGPGLVRLDDNTLLAVVPVVPRGRHLDVAPRVGNSAVHVLRSRDGGTTWEQLAQLPYYSACLWMNNGVLYLFAFQPGTNHRNNDLHLLRSDDGGEAWSEPVVLFKGHYWNCQTGIVIRGGRLYWAVDDIDAGLAEQRVQRAIACDLSADPMDPASWRMSNPVAFAGVPPGLSNPRFAGRACKCLEPNVIQSDGRLWMLTAAKIEGQTIAGLCVVSEVTDNDDALRADFVQYYPMPGGQLKFYVLWDEVSKLFWATSNLVVDSQRRTDLWDTDPGQPTIRCTAGNDRRFLMLMYGADGLNWFPAGCVARARGNSQSFMYATAVVDGDDLAVVARASIDRDDAHDADYATFHRVRGFRRLAMDLSPEY